MAYETQHVTRVFFYSPDLLDQVRLENAIELAGFQPISYEPDNQMSTLDEGILQSSIVDLISKIRPGLCIIDLGAVGTPWMNWIPVLKSDPATSIYPIVCFGPHVSGSLLTLAREMGADLVLPRSKFFMMLNEILLEWVRVDNPLRWLEPCQEQLSAKGIEGIDVFNQGDYFLAHEILEEAWKEELTPGRSLYQAILQVGVAYLQILRGNYRGAIKMFMRVRKWLDPLPSTCRGVDVQDIKENVQIVYNQLVQLGPENIGQFDPSLFRPIKYSL
jgi:hypothetical protein